MFYTNWVLKEYKDTGKSLWTGQNVLEYVDRAAGLQ